MSDIGDRMKAARLRAGYTQGRAAAAVGVHENTMVALERNNAATGVRTVVDLLRLYQKKVPDLDVAAILGVSTGAEANEPSAAAG